MTAPINRGLIRTFKYVKQPQLWLHEIAANTARVSFSKDPSALAVGIAKTSLAHDSQVDINYGNFEPNKDFLAWMHKLFGKEVYNDVAYQMDALNFRSSFLPIGDYKVMLEFMNQRPEFDNTIGFVRVDDTGVMYPDSYESNDVYMLCNADGIVKLTDYMCEKVQENL